MPHVVGIDIGGANLKLADNQGQAEHIPFPLWKEKEKLAEVLKAALKKFGSYTRTAITMTGELADCFITKEEGVDFILSAVEKGDPRQAEMLVWQTSGEFVEAPVAREFWQLTAASNWHALATWGARSVPEGKGLLIDIGSTTTDIIPFESGLPCTQGLTDQGRMLAQELLYMGVTRTPIASVSNMIPRKYLLADDHQEQDESQVRISSEYFATMSDVYLLSHDIPEQPEQHQTADGRPMILSYAMNRIAHQCCCDLNELSETRLRSIASFLKLCQIRETVKAIKHVLIASGLVDSTKLDETKTPKKPLIDQLITAGEGEFLISQILKYIPVICNVPILSLKTCLGEKTSQAACAYALVKLAEDIV